jgi:hypothetical protein
MGFAFLDSLLPTRTNSPEERLEIVLAGTEASSCFERNVEVSLPKFAENYRVFATLVRKQFSKGTLERYKTSMSLLI